MAPTSHYFTRFAPGKFYHVYNRTVDKSRLFANRGNYEYFIRKFDEYLSDYIEIFAYCLLGNHFHFLIKIKSGKTIRDNLKKFEELNKERIKGKQKILVDNRDLHDIVSERWKKFFQSYAMAFNKQQTRIGTLFQRPFKRVEVDTDNYFRNIVYYIHANPQNHGIVDNFRTYEWSSYLKIISKKPSKLQIEELLFWFGGLNGFLDYHNSVSELPSHLDLDD